MAFLGVGLGAAADAAVDTYGKLKQDQRADAALKLEQNADRRAQAKSDREAKSAADEEAYYKGYATGGTPFPGQGGAPVVNDNPNSPSNADKAVGVKPASPDASADGGAVGVQAPQATPASSGSSAKGVGIPLPSGAAQGSESSRAWAAFQAKPSAIGYKNYITARALDAEAAERAATIRMREVQTRAAEHTLNQQDIEDSQKNASRAAERATATLEGYGQMSDDVAATDPRVVENTKRVLTDLQATHSQMADGQVAAWKVTPQGVEVQFNDAKTGKPISTQVLSTVGDVRKAVQTTGMATAPENYPKIIGANALTKMSNEVATLAKSKTQNEISNEQMKSDAIDSMRDINTAIMDPSAVSLLDPASAQALKIKAAKAALQDPDRFEYEVKQPRVGADGQPELDNNGRVIMETTKRNRLMDIIDYNTPKQTATRVDQKTGQSQTMSIDDAAKVTVDRYPQILKETNHDPNLAAQTIRDSLLKQGFDKRVVDWKLPQIMQAGAQQQVRGLVTGSVPNSVAVKQTPAAASAPELSPVGRLVKSADRLAKNGLGPSQTGVDSTGRGIPASLLGRLLNSGQ